MTWLDDFMRRSGSWSEPVLDRFPREFGRSPMMTEPDYEKRIAELEAHVARLQKALIEVDRDWAESEGAAVLTESDWVEHYGLQHGDLVAKDGAS